jgi:alkanesulfonate monooxygenase SsuD/methylene tetrahydromethanopterin reductase-like flavin-dependent oxidoreductase (luciferase family)
MPVEVAGPYNSGSWTGIRFKQIDQGADESLELSTALRIGDRSLVTASAEELSPSRVTKGRRASMEVGLQFLYQNTHDGMSDAEMFRRETEIAVLAEELGLDFIQAPEHHFDPGYCMMPDNMQWCAYMAGRTSRITLGTGAIILPWWENPTRVAEKIAMLEILLGDRFMLGLGRGLAKKEYEAFGVAMSEARERFDTSSELILEMLKTGVAEYDTPHFKQSRVELHPWQPVDWRERGFNSVAMSPDSGVAAANIGGTMMSFVQLPWEEHHEAVEAWRARFHEVHPGKDPGAPIFSASFSLSSGELRKKSSRVGPSESRRPANFGPRWGSPTLVCRSSSWKKAFG